MYKIKQVNILIDNYLWKLFRIRHQLYYQFTGKTSYYSLF